MSKYFELDGVGFDVPVGGGTVDDPVPTFAWASALARKLGGTDIAVASTIILPDNVVRCTFPPDSLTAGVWAVQVRAGVTQAQARTVYDLDITVIQTIRPPA